MTPIPVEGYSTAFGFTGIAIPADNPVSGRPQDAQKANRDSLASAYDSVWAHEGVPTQEATGVEALLLKEDKLYTVLAVVLIIWFGIMFFIVRTDRKLDKLEKSEQ